MTPEALWSDTGPIPVAAQGSHSPTTALSDDTLHLVWARAKTLYHAYFDGETWSEPARIASGEHPALVTAPDGDLHCVFANQFLGNYEIYHVAWVDKRWTLPQNVSRTSGYSTHPVLAIARDGVLHVAWTDMTPGEAVIYHATHTSVGWINGPIPNGRGSMPTITITANEDVYVAWQDRLAATNRYEVFCGINSGGIWQLPEIVSDSPRSHAVAPQLTATSQGHCYIVWQEERNGMYHIRYAARGAGGWAEPEQISSMESDCRLPRVATNPDGFPQALWLAGRTPTHRARPADPTVAWWTAELVPLNCDNPIDLAPTIDHAGRLHVIACVLNTNYNCQLTYVQRQPLPKQTVFVPVVERDV